MQTLLEQFAAQSAPEILAVILAIAYLVLAIRQNIWCWACAFVSTAIYIYLFYDVALFMESALNVFYLLMAVYGWLVWRRGDDTHDQRPVVRWPLARHAVAAAIIACLVFIAGRWLSENTGAALPYWDAFTTWSAVWATYLVAQKVLENWWYWLVIDTVSIFLYLERGLSLTAALYLIYLVMIPFGFIAWRRSWAADRASA